MDESERGRLVGLAHHDIAILFRAVSASPQTVSFFNSKLVNAGGPTPSGPGQTLLERRESFQEEVRELMEKDFKSYDRAFDIVSKRRKAAVVPPTFVNDAATGVPIAAPQFKAMFRLPMDSTQQEFAAAWTGNGGALAPIDPGKIFDALVQFKQKEQPSLDYEAAVRVAKVRYPELWSLVEAIAAQKV
jgi:hypothetical protein